MASQDLQHPPGSPEAIEAGREADKVYIKIGLWLAVLTAIEVALFYFPPGPVEVPALLVLMVVKFVIVAASFMHLKDDNRVLSYLFGIGLALAVPVYMAVMFAEHVF